MAGERLAVAVVGAHGLVGGEIVELLDGRAFPCRELRLLGSLRSAGSEIERGGRMYRLGLLGPEAFEGVDLALFAAGPAVAGEYGPIAAEGGAAVVDVSSRFRLDAGVPLVVPEVNAAEIGERRERGIVASPSATAVALSVVLAPLAAAVGLRRVVGSTYQGVSGAGRRAMESLSRETIELLNTGTPQKRHFARRIAFNCVPQVGDLEPGGATTHEVRVIEETRKVLGDPGLALSLTAVRVPVFYGHCVGVHLETDEPLGAAGAADVLRQAPGVTLYETAEEPYPTPVEIAGSAATHVGRLRDDPPVENGLALWIVLDNVHKGAALNAVEIAEILVRDYL
jgi:aspartate-semialdehyde dehydrogenase